MKTVTIFFGSRFDRDYISRSIFAGRNKQR